MKLENLGLQRGTHYFDHNATTPLFEGAADHLLKFASEWGNPSSIHWASRGPKIILRESRNHFSKLLNCHSLEIIYTSGGTESNNTVVQTFFEQFLLHPEKNHFMCSAVEHPSVLKAFLNLQKFGAQVDIIPVHRNGDLDLQFLKNKISNKTALVSVMMANNETGVVFPTKEISEIVHQAGAYFHVDAVQALGKMPIDLKDLNVDYASFSSHKVNSIKGSGILFVKKGVPFHSMLLGGGQERHRRGGTENVLGISMFHKATENFFDLSIRLQNFKNLRDHFEKEVLAKISDTQVTCIESDRLVNTSSLIIAGIDGETLLMSLDIKGYAVSTGAACSSGSPEPSPVLLALGLTKAEAQNSLRVSFGSYNTLEEVNEFIKVLASVVQRLRQLDEVQGSTFKNIDMGVLHE